MGHGYLVRRGKGLVFFKETRGFGFVDTSHSSA